ncbi:uncharacterized protein LOC126366232 [Pectinophora gossypiella]|uniref:uncharacterized protein LOC126366232 n=1 Tax=Pectinophora gossypiella TaxID=13191 RepID=UPI00214F1A28|nr:uncharacterized protein LOC126366232 [Pectinophora gossypiella]
MNNSAAKVGEIFTEAGAAFNKLAEMTMLLHPMAEQLPMNSQPATKTPIKKKVEERQTTPTNVAPAQAQQNVHSTPISQQVTLNMLNAQESEMDVDDIGNEVKLEFEGSTEEVTT